MIPEEYVTFETAKLLKEAGFPQENGYNIDQPGEDLMMWYDRRGFCEIRSYVNAPTQAQAMRWLREEKDIFVDIENRYGKGTAQWDFKLVDIDNMDNILEFAKKLEYTYEAAAEAGIQAACNHLIKNRQ